MKRTLLGRNGQQSNLGAQFDAGQKVFYESDPDKWFRVFLPLPAAQLTTSGGATPSTSVSVQPQDPFQAVWLTIPPVFTTLNPASTTVGATQVDVSNDFVVTSITVGTVLQQLAEGEMPIQAFGPLSQIPDLVLSGGETSKFFRIGLKTYSTTVEATIRPLAIALKASE